MFKGDIIGLVGENGAGKSTLMKIIGGEYTPNHGTIEYHGKIHKWKNSSQALKLGIVIVHQHPLLVEDFTSEENIFLGKEKTNRFKLVQNSEIRKLSEDLLKEYPLVDNIDLSKPVSTLSAGEKQIVEILKAFSYNPDVLILDEPTASLPKEEANKLLKFIKELNQQKQLSIIFISHKLEETFEICNKMMVMRNGENLGILNKEEFDKNRIVEMMINSKMDNFYPEKKTPVENGPLLRLDGIQTDSLSNINLEVGKGEIVGLYGLMGAGMTDIANIIYGIQTAKEGKIFFEENPISKHESGNIRKMIDKGIFLIPQDRLSNGVFHSYSVKENASIAHLDYISDSSVLINSRKEQNKIIEGLKQLKVKYSNINQSINELSGGNQQKVILGRWLLKQCKLLILDDPTVGIDIGAKKDIYNLLTSLASEGVSILLISSEINEIIGLSERIYTMRRGTITSNLMGDEINQKNILENIL